MKMVKSLLLGSAAGMVAVATGQAADLPVKAKPVEYVKICSLYGAGFYYIPGTDKCLKIGGLLREQWDIHGAGDEQAYFDTTNGTWTRGFTNDSSFRTRGVVTFDVREQSSYGTIRGYIAVGGDLTTPNGQNLFYNRAFVQFAGFTGGKAVSFFDFISFDPYGYANIRPNLGNTGAAGIDVFAYTAQWGNGVSTSISAEDNCALNSAGNGGTVGGRQCRVVNTSVVGSATAVGALLPGTATFAAEGYNIPDVVASIRVDQAWGSAQLAGAYHPVQGNYYGTVASGAGNQGLGHPSDEAGWAASGGFMLKNVLGMQGDTFGAQAIWTNGANTYATNAAGGIAGFSGGANGLGNSIAFGHVLDGVYTSGSAGTACSNVATPNPGVNCGSDIEKTTVWTVGGFYEHKWNPQWKTSLYGGYVRVEYSDTAANYICNGNFKAGWVRGQSSNGYSGPGAVNAGTGRSPLSGTGTGSGVASCDPDFSYWSIGSRTQWNPNSNLDIGVDVVWNHMDSANGGAYNSGTTTFGGRPAGLYNISEYDVLTAAIRAQYNFLP
jgi:hypothetical protein